MSKKDLNWFDIGADIALASLSPSSFAAKKVAEFLGVDLKPSSLIQGEQSPYYEDKSTKVIEHLATNSDASACFVLAKRYSTGTDVLKKDNDKAKYWFDKALKRLNRINVDLISDKVSLGKWLLENNKTEAALMVANKIPENGAAGYLYELIFVKTGEEKYRDEAVERYKATLTETLQVPAVLFKFLDGNQNDKIKKKEIEFKIATFKKLADLTPNSCHKRHFLIGALKEQSFDVKERFNKVNDYVINCFDIAYEELKDKDNYISGDPFSHQSSNEDWDKMLFSSVDYNERQFIYFAKDLKAMAGCYNENLPWVFTPDKYPQEIHFTNVGHPLPNTLYIAHPAKRGMYLPIDNADNELFHDKVRDFRRLSQCLGATEISFHSVKGRLVSEDQSKKHDVEVGGTYKGVEGSVEYGNNTTNSRKEKTKDQQELVQRFNPTKAPYIPNDVAWLYIDFDWQSLVKQRLEGNMLHYSMRISSKKTMGVEDPRMDEVKLAFKTFIANAHVNYSQQMERSFQREDETEWVINVTFKPLDELSDKSEDTQIKGGLQKEELEYIENVRDFLEDDAEITSRERKMLDRIRQSLGISEERAAELEASLKPKLTEDEREYLDMYREYAEEGEITEKARRRLDKFANALGLSLDKVKEIEKYTV